MFIIVVYGNKKTERKLGTVAEFCPLCRSMQPCDLIRIGLTPHIFLLSIGKGKLQGHVARCRECGGEVSANPARYASFDLRDTLDIETLAHVTLPNWREIHGERLALEDQVRSAPLTLAPDTRMLLLIESLRLLDPSVRLRYKKYHMDRQSGLGCLGTFALLVATIVFAFSSGRAADGAVVKGLSVALAFSAFYTFIQLGFGPRRFLRERTVRALVRAWEPLKPTRKEIEEALMRGKSVDMVISKKLPATIIAEQLGV